MIITQETKKQILKEFPFTPTAILVQRYGISRTVILKFAREKGMKKDREALLRWKEKNRKSKKEKDCIRTRHKLAAYIAEDYPYFTDDELADRYGLKVSQIQYIRKRDHLHKDREFLRKPSIERYASSVERYKNNKENEKTI